MRNDKWLINCSYNPHKTNIDRPINELSTSLDLFSAEYEKVIIPGYSNVQLNNNLMKSFCENYALKNVIKQLTCYRNPSNLTYRDLILPNLPRSFKSTNVIGAALSDSNMMTLTVMRKAFKTFQPKLTMGPMSIFQMEHIRKFLINKLSQESFVNNDHAFQRFYDMIFAAFNKYALCKIKHARGDQMPFFDKKLMKAIITRLNSTMFSCKIKVSKIESSKRNIMKY